MCKHRRIEVVLSVQYADLASAGERSNRDWICSTDERFFSWPDFPTGCVDHPFSHIQRVPVPLSSGVNRLRLESEHKFVHSVKFRNAYGYTSTPHTTQLHDT